MNVGRYLRGEDAHIGTAERIACSPSDEGRCPTQRRGKFSFLRCCYLRGHPGECNLVTLGVREWESKRKEKVRGKADVRG